MTERVNFNEFSSCLTSQGPIIHAFHAVPADNAALHESMKFLLPELILRNFPDVPDHVRGVGPLRIIPLIFGVNHHPG